MAFVSGSVFITDRADRCPSRNRLCVDCSKAVGGEFDLTITPENLAKAGSLKKNYGGFTGQKTRRAIPPKSS